MPRKTKWEPQCVFCGAAVPPQHNTVCVNKTPDKYAEHGMLPPGDGWVVCGEMCPVLPRDAVVVYR